MADRVQHQPGGFAQSNQGPGLNLEHDLHLGRGDFWQRQSWPPGDYGTGGGGFELQGPPSNQSSSRQGRRGNRGQPSAKGVRMHSMNQNVNQRHGQGQARMGQSNRPTGLRQSPPQGNRQRPQGGGADWGTQPYYGGYGYDFRGQGFGGMAQGYPNRGFGNPNQPTPGTSWRQGPHAGKGPKRSDARIQDEVSARLTQHGNLDASNITVQVDHGEVTLSGSVGSRQDKREAERVADAVPGVQDVHNQLTIQAGSSQAQNLTVH